MCSNPFKVVTNVIKGVVGVANDVVGGVAGVAHDVVDYGATKVVNTVKDVSGYTAAENKAKEDFKKAQAAAEKLAKERQDELNRLASVREAQATEQRNALTVLMQKQEQAEADQIAQVEGLQRKQADVLAQLENEQLATTAAGASLRVLAQKKTAQAPTAKLSGRRKSRSNAAYRSPTSKLSVGSSGRDAGVGVNLGG